LNSEPVLYSPAAIGTKFEIAIERFPTIPARPGFFLVLTGVIRTKLMQSLLTSIAHDKRFAFFDPDYRNEKKVQIMVHAFIISLIQSANRAPAGILIQNLYFGRNTGDENHLRCSLGSGFQLLVSSFFQPQKVSLIVRFVLLVILVELVGLN
jgi:hypothetical protein